MAVCSEVVAVSAFYFKIQNTILLHKNETLNYRNGYISVLKLSITYKLKFRGTMFDYARKRRRFVNNALNLSDLSNM